MKHTKGAAPIASTRIRAISSKADCLSSTLCSSLRGTKGGSIFSEQERAALAWAEEVTRLGERGVSNNAFDAATAVFGEKQLVDLTLAIGVINAYNRIAISFRARPIAGPD